MTLDAFARERDNNFDVLRLAAAMLVLVSHAFVVTGAAEPHIGRWPLGTLGVEIFFAISGFLVAKSWLSDPRVRAFAVKRGLRILPALAVTVVACAFVLGPIVSGDPVRDYFTSAQPISYVADNLVSVVSGGAGRDVAGDLPGVFSSNPDPSVNLSLWTLPIEVRAYMMLALLGLVGILGRALPLVAAGFFCLSIAPWAIADTPAAGSALEFLRGADGVTAHFTAVFAMSALAWVWRTRIPLRADLAAVALAAVVASLGTPAERLLLLFSLPYLVLFFAFRSWPALRALTRHADVSYGVYLLAFPVQQTIVYAWGSQSPAPLPVALIAFPVTYLLALASWRYVEKPALRLKGALTRRGSPRAGPSRPAHDPKPAPIRP